MNIIDGKTKDTLLTKHPRIARFYTLPKIHKDGNPGRPIVNSIGTITEKLSAYIDQHIRPLVPNIPTYIKDTTDFINTIEGIQLDPTDLLVTIDVSALYTSIPHNEGLMAINKALENQYDPLLKTFICRLTHQVLIKNYFTFNGKFYHQIQGTAMGTRMAPSYANLFMYQLESNILRSLILKPDYWYRYIDDIFAIWTHGPEELHHMMTILNHYHPTIKFTHSYDYHSIPFLDTLVCRDINNKLYTKLYHKPTDNKHYLHFHSAHPRKQKESVPYGLLIRCRRICHKLEDFNREADIIINKLRQRKYPMNLLVEARNIVTRMQRSNLLRSSTKGESNKVRLITNYNPMNPDFGKILKKHEDILLLTRKYAITPDDIQVTYSRSPNLKDILVRANLKYEPTPRMCQPCYKTHCRTCQHINTNIAVTNTISLTLLEVILIAKVMTLYT